MRARGRLEEAKHHLDEAQGTHSVGLITRARSRVLLAEILLDLGDAAAAAETASTAVEESGEETVGRVEALRILATALLAQGKATDAEAAIREELSLLDQADWDVEKVRALGVLARALDAERRHDEAAEVLDRARALLAEQPVGTDTSTVEGYLRA
jgi:tetratricopeptide (TPR) repeat protein